MKNIKSTIVVAFLTTLLTNFLLSSVLFWVIAFIALWLYMGYLSNVMDSYNTKFDSFVLFGPFGFFISLMENGTAGLRRLWYHWFGKPMPTIRSPFVFEDDE